MRSEQEIRDHYQTTKAAYEKLNKQCEETLDIHMKDYLSKVVREFGISMKMLEWVLNIKKD
jgi:hypothetical protein